MSTTLLAAGWLASGVLGYFLTRWAWTKDLDWTTRSRALVLVVAAAGPASVYLGILVLGLGWLYSRDDRVLKEARR